MMFKLSTVAFAAFGAVFLLAGQVSALADNPVDACNGSNHYGEGHSCSFKSGDGQADGYCHFTESGVLTCDTA
ncbi:hypothetical protein K523DRAFT_268394 [Schizophyllum commune Tattone D]|nr:hypothetical protein K525DRAFT_268385 [Schizophyllum commune Loenen D]KAI5832098.1 hypothetical protein K523DRAFT_268394 [Schizophyllum commune Tattone D]